MLSLILPEGMWLSESFPSKSLILLSWTPQHTHNDTQYNIHKPLLTDRATKSLHQLVIADPGKTLVLLAQIGAQGVGGFQSDVSYIRNVS